MGQKKLPSNSPAWDTLKIMVIKPRSLEEIAAERAKSQIDLSSNRDASPRPTSPSKRDEDFFDPFDDESSPLSSSSSKQPGNGYEGQPALPPEPKNYQLFFLAGGTLLGTVLAVWIVYSVVTKVEMPPLQSAVQPINAMLLPSRDPIEIRITLDNQCEFEENVFMVKVMPDGPTANFTNGQARLVARPDQRIKLMANERYPFLSYEDASVKVAPEVSLTARCYDPEERAKALQQSFEDRFGK
jgi:hypothetical protein